jgi:hypothetical protein
VGLDLDFVIQKVVFTAQLFLPKSHLGIYEKKFQQQIRPALTQDTYLHCDRQQILTFLSESRELHNGALFNAEDAQSRR